MQKLLIIPFFIVTSLASFAQIDVNANKRAYPEIGWDSLTIKIQNPENYPIMAKRAGVTTHIYVSVSIDSTGKVINVEPAGKRTLESETTINKLFIPTISEVISSVKWNPSYKNNKPTNDKILLLFNFYLIDPSFKTFNIIAPREKSKAYY